VRLDWILVSEELDFVRYVTLPDRLSDHLGVVAEVRRLDLDARVGVTGARTSEPARSRV